MARIDHAVIAEFVAPNSRVLDVGCADGALMELLIKTRGATARGMEIDQEGVNACVAKGLAVVQGDADTDLAFFPDNGFDYVVLSSALQAVRQPRKVLQELMRIGPRVIVSFPNFGHWKVRTTLMFSGRMPMTKALPADWAESENIHLCTVRDFAAMAQALGLTIERAAPISGGHAGATFAKSLWRANWFAEEAVFLLNR